MIDPETGFIWLTPDNPLRPVMRLQEYLESPLGPQGTQQWSYEQHTTVYTDRPLRSIGDVHFGVTLYFEHEQLYVVELNHLVKLEETWFSRLQRHLYGLRHVRVPSPEESLVVCTDWLRDQLGQEADGQHYPWGFVSVEDVMWRGEERIVFLRIKYWPVHERR